MHPIPPDDAPHTGLAGRLRLARAVLVWERLWPALVPPLSLVGSFLALALMDVLPLLPGWLHGLVLAGHAGGIAFLGWRGLARLRLPAAAEAARRLERDSALSHRPLSTLADRLAAGGDDPLAAALWQAHRRRLAGLVARLALRWPSPGMAERDPWGWRALAVLLLAIGIAAGGHEPAARVSRALAPAVDGAGGERRLDVWITPPAYTGAPPQALTAAESGRPLTVPAGSAVLAVVGGGWGTATLSLGGRGLDFQPMGEGGQRLEARIDGGRTLSVSQGWQTLGRWPLTVIADRPPAIAVTAVPADGERGRLRLGWTAADDYGVTRARVEIRRADAPEGETLVVELPLPGGGRQAVDGDSVHDLSGHPWAGLEVMATPIASDALGQDGAGKAIPLVLPERSFADPVARRLAELRRLVTADRRVALPVAMALDPIIAQPALVRGDLTVLLALALARAGLSGPSFDLAEVQDLLWNAALTVEEGDLAGAERAMEEARSALAQALDSGASEAEIRQLLDRFQAAMERLVAALAARGAVSPSSGEAGNAVSTQELAQMMQAMRGMAESGARDALRRMADALAQMLSTLGAGPPPPQAAAAARAMKTLEDLARRQQELMDQTFRRAQEGAPARGDGEAAERQRALRQGLGAAMRSLAELGGDVPAGLRDAEGAMGSAVGDLAKGAWGSAAEAQGQALDRLREGARQAMERMAPMMMPGAALGPRDPIGRPLPGTGAGDDGATRIPTVGEVQKARQLLDEIRRRSGDAGRPAAERDYLHRLLKQF
ncbi:MAG: DUF4175 family protein [Magnetospirillum sp.]|nr:DUF4175 family protein [Magnetospirillum sp.]